MRCALAPPSINFRIVDSRNNEDVVANGALAPANIKVINENGKQITSTIQGNDTLKIVSVAGFEQGLHNYKIIAGDREADFSVEITGVECGASIKQLEIQSPYTLENGLYIIKI